MLSRIPVGLEALVVMVSVAGCAKKPADTSSAADSAKMSAAATPRVDTAAALAEIRKGDSTFMAAANAGDVDAAVAGYAPDAISNPPNSPPLVGHDAIRKYNADFLKLPKLHITGSSETIRFSDDGTMAWAEGSYALTFADPKGHTVKDEGKYLNVLRQVNGNWVVVADAFSSNNPPPK
jgi:ketosteroid isomerase-like protein